jgi:hypothetical protein
MTAIAVRFEWHAGCPLRKGTALLHCPLLAANRPDPCNKVNQIYKWKKQLLDGAVSVFEDGGATPAGAASEAQVDLLYQQIGQLKVENDFLSRKLGK